MLVEAAHRELRAPGDLADGSVFVAVFTEQGEPGGFQARSFFQAASLQRRGGKIFSGEQVGTQVYDFRHCGMSAPMTAPAQHQSSHPPNTPATCGDMFGYSAGKKTQEKGSSHKVGSATETAPARNSSRGSCAAMQRRRTSQATSGKLAAKRVNVPSGSAGRSRYWPAMRKAMLAASQITRPVRRRVGCM